MKLNERPLLEDYSSAYYTYEGKLIDLMQLESKVIYWHLIKQIAREPRCILKWQEVFPKLKQMGKEIWLDIFCVPLITIQESKIQMFQFKLIHRIINCNSKLYNWGLSNSPNCSYCGENDDLIHFFIACPEIRELWKSISKWWNRHFDFKMNLLDRDILECLIFGYLNVVKEIVVLNFIIYYAKYYIYKSRLFYQNKVSLYEFQVILKNKLQFQTANNNRTITYIIERLSEIL
jgi:hypothetical protein